LIIGDDGTPRVGGELFVENLPNTDNTSATGRGGDRGGDRASTGGIYRGVAPGAHLVGLSVGEGGSVALGDGR
jgi:hypothetical protein